MVCNSQTYCNNNNTEQELIACVLTSQYINHFERGIPHYATIILAMLNLLFAIAAVLLNLLIIIAIMSTPKLKTPTFILLCNLALTDLIIGILIGPFEVFYLVTRALQQYDVFCTVWKILVALSYILCPLSLYTITCISYDRYLSLMMRVKYKSVVTKRKTLYTLVCLWVWSIVGASFMVLLGKAPFLALVCCISFICLAVIGDCYILSFAAIKERQLEIKASTSVMTKECDTIGEVRKTATKNAKRESDVMEYRSRDDQSHSYFKNEMGGDSVQKLKVNIESPEKAASDERTLQHNPTKLKYLRINKDIETVIEKIEVQDEVQEVDNCNSERMILNKHSFSIKEDQHETNLQTPSTIQNSALLADVERFRKTLHTILIIVIVLFLCYLPYLVVSTLVTLRIINIGIAWDAAASIVYMNSSISPIILCTRIANVRKACARVLRKICS